MNPGNSTPAPTARAAAHVRRFALARGVSVLGWQMVSVAVGWELYERTRDPWSLGLVGLVELLPVVFLMVPAGILNDRLPRRNVGIVSMLGFGLAALGLMAVTRLGLPVTAVYGLLVLVGVSRAFGQPSMASYLPELASPEVLSRANAWVAASYEVAAIGGPAAAGLLIAATGGAEASYAAAAFCQVAFALILLTLPARRPTLGAAVVHSAAELFAGFRFIRRTPVFLAAITLDLLAVLLGGAVALLPVYARDVLDVGPTGLGWLRTAPAAGALLMSLIITRLPPWPRPGRVLLAVVTVFGIATVGFGLSQSLWLSLACLFVVGASDAVSVVIRMTLEQVITPDQLRGRVSAIHFLFVGCSNELGAFESGALASLVGPVAAVVAGGVGAVAVVGLVAGVWPELARIGPLHTLRPAADPGAS